jgi:hypothetical protein
MKNFVDFSADDFAIAKEGGVDAFMGKATADAANQLSRAFDSAIQAFVDGIEKRSVPLSEIMHGGMFVKLATSAQDAPDAWENFFVYRKSVLAYRYLTGTHADDKTHAVNMEFTLQTLPLTRDQWPKALANFIKSSDVP